MNIEKIVKSVNFDVKNMQSVITSLFNQTISAIKSIKVSSNSYSDNRNISIRGDSRDILNALQNRVGLAVSKISSPSPQSHRESKDSFLCISARLSAYMLNVTVNILSL